MTTRLSSTGLDPTGLSPTGLNPTGLDPGSLAYDDRGLVASVVQDIASGAVLMLAWANRQAVEQTLATGYAHFWSRSRQKLWKKGETSGNVLRVREIRADCDRDALLLRVDPAGPACHQGTRTCFEPNDAQAELGWLAAVLASRRLASEEASYTASLLAAGIPRIAQKVGEEAVETVIAALDGSDDFADEAADLLYHLLVLCQAKGVSAGAIAQILRSRHIARDGSS
jgi:phosphoribosyl-ATP pyrophosphohydrolase